MKTSVRVFAITFLGILLIASCITVNSPDQDVLPSPTWVATQNAQEEYSKALSRWQSHSISNYEITIDIFSSMLPPPCFMKGVLKVQNNQLVGVIETETPMPIPMPDGSVIYNPDCHEYENYLVSKQFEKVEKLLIGQLPYQWNVKFDPEYGYITELIYTPGEGSESLKDVHYSNFKPK